MKSHLAKVSLALLSAVFVLGCQDMGSGPVAPDDLGPQFAKAIKNCDPEKGPVHRSCKDGDGGGGPTAADATVVLSDGMTSTAQDVRIQRESDSEIHFEDVRDGTGASTFESVIALTATRLEALADLDDGGFPGSSGCVVKPANTSEAVMRGLLAKLSDGVQVRFFLLSIDKTALGSASKGHGIGSTFTDGTGQLISLMGAGTKKRLLPGVSATVALISGNINGDFTVEFSGGAVSVWDRTGKVKDHVDLVCPNLDKITAAVIRSS